MPFFVKKWPDRCDPRESCFCIKGYDATGVPPLKYQASTVGALPPYDLLNGLGQILEFVFVGAFEACEFQFEVAPVLFTVRTQQINGPGLPPAPASTLLWRFDGSSTGPAAAFRGAVDARLPQPTEQPPNILTFPVAGPNLVPNPIVLLPRPWFVFLPVP